jgi:SPP1 family predicted phage head-tail adaptor
MREAGALNRRIIIQQQSQARDPFGQPMTYWTDVVQTWAAISAPTSREIYGLGPGFTAQVTHKVTIRWRPGIKSAMRIVYGGRIFQIQTLSDPDEGRDQIDLMCLEINEGQP